jgi:hypothetical protein
MHFWCTGQHTADSVILKMCAMIPFTAAFQDDSSLYVFQFQGDAAFFGDRFSDCCCRFCLLHVIKQAVHCALAKHDVKLEGRWLCTDGVQARWILAPPRTRLAAVMLWPVLNSSSNSV